MTEEKRKNDFILITGMSGAGKSSVLRMLEDSGYFCVDNLPAQFLPHVSEEEQKGTKIAACIDIRSGLGLQKLETLLPELKRNEAKILFMEASDESLIRRYKETRRLHPLICEGRIEDAIRLEREKLFFLKQNADFIIDTSRLLTRELRAELNKIMPGEEIYTNLVVTILSFGFKYGIPSDADLVFDVRFLPNPFYIEELKPRTGNDKAVYDFVMKSEMAKEFLKKLIDMVEFLIPKYREEGKTNLVLAIGCTGGKHRSVTLANALMEWFKKTEFSARVEHREI